MNEFVIRRVSTGVNGTFGVFLNPSNIPFAVTLEREWLNNKKSVSCIPAGRYMCLRCSESPDYGYQDSPKFGDTFQVFNVPGREKILFHKGNIDDDSHGCILVGEQFDVLNNQPAILASKHGFDEFKRLTAAIDQFELIIADDWARAP